MSDAVGMETDFLTYLAFALLATPIAITIWLRQRERAQWRRAAVVVKPVRHSA